MSESVGEHRVRLHDALRRFIRHAYVACLIFVCMCDACRPDRVVCALQEYFCVITAGFIHTYVASECRASVYRLLTVQYAGKGRVSTVFDGTVRGNPAVEASACAQMCTLHTRL